MKYEIFFSSEGGDIKLSKNGVPIMRVIVAQLVELYEANERAKALEVLRKETEKEIDRILAS